MNPFTAALERCIHLLKECKEGQVSLLISNEQIAQMKTRSVHNRVRYNLSHQLADLIIKDAEISKAIVASDNPCYLKGEDTQFTLRTVIMKATTYIDLLQGLNVLLAAALNLAYTESVPEVDDRQYVMFSRQALVDQEKP